MSVLGLKLVLAHVIGDFAFQPDKWVQDKIARKQKSPYLYWHLLIHALALGLVLQFDFTYWKGMLMIVVSHYLIDLGKLYLTGKLNTRILFFLDQLAHLIIIAVVIYIYEPYTLAMNEVVTPKILLLTLAILGVGPVSAVIMKVI